MSQDTDAGSNDLLPPVFLTVLLTQRLAVETNTGIQHGPSALYNAIFTPRIDPYAILPHEQTQDYNEPLSLPCCKEEKQNEDEKEQINVLLFEPDPFSPLQSPFFSSYHDIEEQQNFFSTPHQFLQPHQPAHFHQLDQFPQSTPRQFHQSHHFHQFCHSYHFDQPHQSYQSYQSHQYPPHKLCSTNDSLSGAYAQLACPTPQSEPYHCSGSSQCTEKVYGVKRGLNFDADAAQHSVAEEPRAPQLSTTKPIESTAAAQPTAPQSTAPQQPTAQPIPILHPSHLSLTLRSHALPDQEHVKLSNGGRVSQTTEKTEEEKATRALNSREIAQTKTRNGTNGRFTRKK